MWLVPSPRPLLRRRTYGWYGLHVTPPPPAAVVGGGLATGPRVTKHCQQPAPAPQKTHPLPLRVSPLTALWAVL